jgi:5-azacytidine-induced protein 1
VQKFIDHHEAELETIRAAHKTELTYAEKRVKHEMLQEIERLKVEFQRDKEAACISEREMARQRLQKQFEDEERLLQERRMKLLKQAEEEREKYEQLVSHANRD